MKSFLNGLSLLRADEHGEVDVAGDVFAQGAVLCPLLLSQFNHARCDDDAASRVEPTQRFHSVACPDRVSIEGVVNDGNSPFLAKLEAVLDGFYAGHGVGHLAQPQAHLAPYGYPQQDVEHVVAAQQFCPEQYLSCRIVAHDK